MGSGCPLDFAGLDEYFPVNPPLRFEGGKEGSTQSITPEGETSRHHPPLPPQCHLTPFTPHTPPMPAGPPPRAPPATNDCGPVDPGPSNPPPGTGQPGPFHTDGWGRRGTGSGGPNPRRRCWSSRPRRRAPPPCRAPRGAGGGGPRPFLSPVHQTPPGGGGRTEEPQHTTRNVISCRVV